MKMSLSLLVYTVYLRTYADHIPICKGNICWTDLLNMKKRDAYISTIGVLREFQGLGVGSALIKSAIEVAALNAMKRVILEVSNGNVAAVNLYRKMGFIVRGQGGGKTYEGAIQMKKSI